MGVLLVVGVVVIILFALPFGLYNRLVRLRNTVHESWRDIDTELQRRYDLIPNLVNTVKGYAAHESAVFEHVTSLRASAMETARVPASQAPVQQALGQGMGQLMAVAEQYPDLKANQQFLTLQHELIDTEDRIQVSRRIYNANVRTYDSLVQTFPSMIVARLGGFSVEPFFEIDPAVRDAGPPSVELSHS